jgi:hypothetical protein
MEKARSSLYSGSRDPKQGSAKSQGAEKETSLSYDLRAGAPGNQAKNRPVAFPVSLRLSGGVNTKARVKRNRIMKEKNPNRKWREFWLSDFLPFIPKS